MSLKDHLTHDCEGEPIDPDETYLVWLERRTLDFPSHHLPEYVTGEELLAAADFLDQLLSQKERKDDTDDKQTDI